MLSRSDQVERIVTAWALREAESGLVRTDRTTAMALAMVALTALECGERHPDRVDVRCTDLPHEQGHVYHRDNERGLEWWDSGVGIVNTVHDVLGPIQLVRSGVAVAGGSEDDARKSWCCAKHGDPDRNWVCALRKTHPGWHATDVEHEDWPDSECEPIRQPPDRYHTLPTCENDQTPEDPTNDSDRPGTTSTDLAVYRDLIPILTTVEAFLHRAAKRYRDGNTRITAEMCRAAEDHRDHLRDTAGMLQDLLDGTGN